MKLLKNILAILLGIIISLGLCELILNIYNPLPGRIKGDKIILPVNVSYDYKNENIPSLDSVIYHKKNSLGFRGPELESANDNSIRILTIGGSTTECRFVSDGKDWPTLLGLSLEKKGVNVWLNNAGLDGHSTHGHQILLEDHAKKLNPDYIIFLVGVNDIGRDDLGEYDKTILKENSIMGFIRNTETYSIYKNISMMFKAKNQNLGHEPVDFKNVKSSPTNLPTLEEKLEIHKKYIDNYAKRLDKLIRTCVSDGIKPILLTQPSVLGYEKTKDSVTGVDMGLIVIRENGENGHTRWSIQEAYNKAAIKVARDNNILCIDLANLLDKNTNYFYDEIHFTNAGCKEISRIISDPIYDYISKEN